MKTIDKKMLTVMRNTPQVIYDWNELLKEYRMPEWVIEEFADKWNWTYVWQYQYHLKSKFIEDNNDKINRVSWCFICFRWNIDQDFVLKHGQNIDWYMLSRNLKIKFTQEFKAAFKNRVNWKIADEWRENQCSIE